MNLTYELAAHELLLPAHCGDGHRLLWRSDHGRWDWAPNAHTILRAVHDPSHDAGQVRNTNTIISRITSCDMEFPHQKKQELYVKTMWKQSSWSTSCDMDNPHQKKEKYIDMWKQSTWNHLLSPTLTTSKKKSIGSLLNMWLWSSSDVIRAQFVFSSLFVRRSLTLFYLSFFYPLYLFVVTYLVFFKN